MRSTGDAAGTGLHPPDGTDGIGGGGGNAGGGGAGGGVVTASSHGVRRHVVDRAGERVLPRPVPLEVPVALVHEVVEPPVDIDAARPNRGDDAADVVVLGLHAGRVRRRDVLAQPGVDLAELG